ncbi:hypothetical protein SBOR_0254 [Sclerotinia borealis F-4128]|uniref:2EXR domain-containing protein n=1 Tax=Sclerotinia borealis (strain F-4128) TaxID=1432307 RepID=W9CXJ9_SCLBF|nr:hypothetical protein SBOR_0254 [Sclerotinia borealis F-4128]
MSSIDYNISLFAGTPIATVAEFTRAQWLDLALVAKIDDQQVERLGWLDLEKNSGPHTPVGAIVPVVQVMAPPPASSFQLFGELAIELRNKIWAMVSSDHSRIITIIEEDVNVAIHPNDDEYTVTGAKRPRFLRTCKGALTAMVGVYRPMFHLDSSKYHGEKKGVFVNPDVDVIDFVSLRFLHGQAPPLGYISALKYRGEFSMIRHVCLPVQEFHDNFQKVARMIREIPLLESVVVEANLIDLTLPDDRYLQFEFQDVHYTRPNRSPRSDMTIKAMNGGFPLVGLPAIGLLFNRITNLTHRAGVMETLGRIETMMRQESNFPDRVLGQFNYHNH